MTESEIMREIFRAILDVIESTLHRIGSVINGEARKAMLAEVTTNGQTHKYIYDKGDMFRNATYVVVRTETGLSLKVGSNVKHESFVLGGKVPSWTPLDPLKSWVERKGLTWTDKQSGKALSIDSIAYIIRRKIKREGIAARDIYTTIFTNRQSWIIDQLEHVVVKA
jgi:hypothetical protein